MFRRIIAFKLMLLIMLALFMPAGAFAIPYKVGDYTIDVEVRNSAMNLIPNPKVNCWLNGNKSITIKARATGYLDAHRTITVYPNQFFYKADLTLKDLKTKVRIYDLNENPISSAYARTDQYGFPGDKFGLTVFIPTADWPNATSEAVDVIEPFWGLPYKKTCEIDTVDQFYRVRIAIPREALEWSGGDLYVLFRTKVPNRPEIIAKRVARLADLSANNPQARLRLSEFLAKSYSITELRTACEILPCPLESLIQAREKFHRLHNEIF